MIKVLIEGSDTLNGTKVKSTFCGKIKGAGQEVRIPFQGNR